MSVEMSNVNKVKENVYKINTFLINFYIYNYCIGFIFFYHNTALIIYNMCNLINVFYSYK